ncbi:MULTISPECIES: hypothetical protein [Kitasatospora]|uniref:Uncharacterized protein n=1 Tax=Kitasatospora cystarginea TaxID=58350 RepID=A0ABP5RQP8_9ACTN
MTEMAPPPLGTSPTARPVTRPDHVPRLHEALHEHSGCTARLLPGAPAITHSDYAVATGAPASAIHAQQHGGRVDLNAVHVLDAGSPRGTPTG